MVLAFFSLLDHILIEATALRLAPLMCSENSLFWTFYDKTIILPASSIDNILMIHLLNLRAL